LNRRVDEEKVSGSGCVQDPVGGRDLPDEFTFKTFCDWIRHELEEELRRRWKIKANGVGVPASQAMAAG